MKADESELPGVDAWRKMETPSPPRHLYETGDTRSAPSKAPYRLRWAAVAFACALTAGVMMWPQRSAAAELQKVLDASAARAFFEQDLYIVGPDGKLNLQSQDYVHGKDVRMIDADPPEDFSEIGARILQYRPRLGSAATFLRTRTPKRYANLDLANLINPTGAYKVVKEAGKLWQGRSVDIYHVDSEFTDGQGIRRHSHGDVIVDSASQLPLELRSSGLDLGPDVVWKYRFPPFDPALMQVKIPEGVPVYDVDKQRARLMSSVITPIAKTTVAGQEIDLRVLAVDHDGIVEAVTSGGWTQPPTDEYWNHQLEVYGFPARFPFDPPTGVTDRGKRLSSMPSYVYPQPVSYQGLALVHCSATCDAKAGLPERITIRVPVWKQITTDVIPTESLFLGWAVFKDAKPVWTDDVVQLLRPLNVSIFQDPAPPRP